MKLCLDSGNRRYFTSRASAANFRRLRPFLDAADAAPDSWYRFTSEGFMPLSVENLHETFLDFPVYSIMHTYILNGDVMRDPEMTILCDRAHGHIIPLTFRQDGCSFSPSGTYLEEVFKDETHYYPRAASDLDSFLSTWSRNIREQGFDPAQAQPAVTLDEFSALAASESLPEESAD